MHVYAIEANGQTKIGRSASPEKRMANIASQGGFVLERTYASAPLLDSAAVELQVHSDLADRRGVGEWFTVDFDDAVDAIKKAELDDAMGRANQHDRSWTDRLASAMKDRGIKQKDICALLSVTPGAVSSWFSSRYSPSVSQLKAICVFVGVSMDYILGIGADPTDSADAIISTLTTAQRAQALRMLKAFAESCRAPE